MNYQLICFDVVVNEGYLLNNRAGERVAVDALESIIHVAQSVLRSWLKASYGFYINYFSIEKNESKNSYCCSGTKSAFEMKRRHSYSKSCKVKLLW